MPDQNSPDAAFEVQLASLLLRRLAIERLGPLQEDSSRRLEANLGIGAAKQEGNQLAVEMVVSVDHEGVVKLSATYRAVFRASDEVPDEQWREFAARTAPTVMYPYIRETITGLVVKAGLPQLFTPILNFAAVFDPEDVDLDASAEPPTEAAEPLASDQG